MMIQKFKTLSLFIIFAFAIVISTSGVVIAIAADQAQTGGATPRTTLSTSPSNSSIAPSTKMPHRVRTYTVAVDMAKR
jgi:hypothetical protein